MAQPLSLLTLPDELLLGVLSHLPGEPESLSAIACACRRLQDLAEPFIFASNLITNGSQVPRLSHALTARKERLRSVHSLDLRCRFEHTAGMTSMMTLLPALVNLKQLTIESPWCNRPRVSPPAWDDEVESYARIFRDASLLANSYDGGPTQPLARLQSCTLHWSGAQKRHWHLDQAVALFLHPTLRELTISCADAEETNIDIPFKNYRGSTSLRQLTLIECNISLATMELLLSLPSALQSLDFTTRRGTHRTKKASLASLIRILVAHQPKLESLTYANMLESWYKDQTEASEIDLSLLGELKYFALPYDNGRRSVHLDSMMKRMSPNQVFASLETVSIGVELGRLERKDSVLSYHRNLGLQQSRCPHLRTLIVALGSLADLHDESEDSGNESISFEAALKKRLLEDFKERKVRIILQETTRHRYIPPYLFGEKAPERRTIFDSGAEEVMAS